MQKISAECQAQRSKKSTAHAAHTGADMFNILHAYTATASAGRIKRDCLAHVMAQQLHTVYLHLLPASETMHCSPFWRWCVALQGQQECKLAETNQPLQGRWCQCCLDLPLHLPHQSPQQLQQHVPVWLPLALQSCGHSPSGLLSKSTVLVQDSQSLMA